VIDSALNLFRHELNANLARGVEGGEDRVIFPNGDKGELEFRLEKVTLLLAGIQEEPILRPADRYIGMGPDGAPLRVKPLLRVSLMVLIAARHSHYDESLRALSQVIVWCQSHPVLDRTTTPQLDPLIDRLTLELMTLTLAEQNELWSGLGTGYVPSVLYRMRLLAFSDAEGTRTAATVTQANRSVLHHAS
jgi:hypothetical protein